MRLFLVVLILVLLCTGCLGRTSKCQISEGYVQSTSQNDPSRRAMYPAMKDAEYDSLAAKECYTTIPKK